MAVVATFTRAAVVDWLEHAREQLLASIDGLTEEQMHAGLPNGWSVKDILAHVAMWDEVVLPDIGRAARGDKRAFDSWDPAFMDRWNEIQFALRQAFPLSQVLVELRGGRRTLMELLASLPDECLTSGSIPVTCGIQARHDRDHAVQIRAWRQKEGI